MSIDFDFQIYFTWFKHQNLWHTNVEKGANWGTFI